MNAETIFPLIGLLLALAVAANGLRGALERRRHDKALEKDARRDRERREFGGPWGG